MPSKNTARRFIYSFALLLSLSLAGPAQQTKTKPQGQALGTPVLWREPSDLASRNLFLGPGGEAMKPDLSKVTLVEEKESSGSPKFRVRDGSGREWSVKVGGEVRSEVAASRLIWAVGYFTDISYFIPSVEIGGKGVIQNARFEARPKGVKRLEEWMWDDNPFNGTKELQGLKVLLALLDNWNLKNENNKILFIRDDEAGSSELRYIISDLDTKYDKTGASPAIWNPAPGKSTPPAKFIETVRGVLDFGYTGKHSDRMNGIAPEHARWIGTLLARLTDQQLKDALRSANYNPDEIQLIAKGLRARINELNSLTK